jgi:hypothetical protein
MTNSIEIPFLITCYFNEKSIEFYAFKSMKISDFIRILKSKLEIQGNFEMKKVFKIGENKRKNYWNFKNEQEKTFEEIGFCPGDQLEIKSNNLNHLKI